MTKNESGIYNSEKITLKNVLTNEYIFKDNSQLITNSSISIED